MVVRVEDLCHSCKYFDIGNYECKQGHFLDGESEKFTIECDDYDKGDENGISYEAIIHTPHCPEDFNTTIWDKLSDFELFLMFCALFMKEGDEIDK